MKKKIGFEVGSVTRTSEEVAQDLYNSIQARPRPEDVAQLVLEILGGHLTPGEISTIDKAASRSLKRGAYHYTSMLEDFARPKGADRQAGRAARAFKFPVMLTAAECLDAASVETYLRKLAPLISADPEHLNFRIDRKNREQRKTAGITDSHRIYNRKFRTLRRLGWKLDRMTHEGKKYNATRISKSAGATKVTLDDLRIDAASSCFIAYLSARMNERSAFTNGSQVRAYDDISEVLFKHAKKSWITNWWAIAMVHPEKEVLDHLAQDQKGRLLGMWTETLHEIAGMLGKMHAEQHLDLVNMVVQRGNDSTTWNALAGAWNKAREFWMKIVYDLGMEYMLETYCPGKVMRLMAADVVGWHAGSDGLHPDTRVWGELPHPWQVFEGKRKCPRQMVLDACVRHGVKADGWAGPSLAKVAVRFRPTPELVHGVSVSSPYLAKVIRDAGWFSGQGVNDPFIDANVIRDKDGAVIMVRPEDENTAEVKSAPRRPDGTPEATG